MSAILLGFLGKYRLQFAVLFLALSAFLFWSHHEYQRGVAAQVARDEKALKVAQAKADRLSADLAAKSSQIGNQARQAQTRIVTRTHTIIERVPYEIPADRDPMLGGGFLRLYNASLGLPEGSSPSPGTDQPDPGLRSSDALRSIVGNNASCQLWQDRAERLSALYESVRATINN